LQQLGWRVAAAGACLVGAATTAAAQEPRVQVKHVKVDVPPRVVLQVQRIVRDAIGQDAGREIGAAIHGALHQLSWLGRLSAVGGPWQDRDLRVELPPQKETKTLQLGADGSLDVRNYSGDITITAGGGRTATVEITRKARGRTDADAKQGLERVQVEVTERADRATIETRYPRGERGPRNYSVAVIYNITAPAGTRMALSTLSGVVTVKGIKGDLTLDVTSGAINVSDAGRITTAKILSGPLTLTNVTSDAGMDVSSISGDVTLQQVKARRVAINVVSGNVFCRDVASDDVQMTTMNGSVELSGPLTRRGRYDLQTYSGVVKLLVSGAIGFDLKADTFSGQIRVEPPLETRAGAGSRRSVRSLIGDGSASVTLHAFSGDILITRKQ
jgi:hypothetical protein